MNRYETQLRALRAAFPYTIPIFAGFWFLGLTYGIYMNVSGFSFVYPMLMSLTIFAGSVEFVTVNLLLGVFNPVQALLLTIMINARHLFYGLSMLDKFRGLGAPADNRFYDLRFFIHKHPCRPDPRIQHPLQLRRLLRGHVSPALRSKDKSDVIRQKLIRRPDIAGAGQPAQLDLRHLRLSFQLPGA